jgi:SH3-like domain-containing protein
VSKDKVNVRARADKNSEVVAQLKKGEAVKIVEHKGEWLRIRLPDAAKCYVGVKFIKNGQCTGDRVYVRCGEGLNFKDLGKLAKGDKVHVVATKGEWTQIKPTADCSGWVAANLVEIAAPAPPPIPVAPPVITNAPEIATAPVPAPPVVAPPVVPAPMVAPIPVAEPGPEVYVQYVVKDGILHAVKEPGAPAAYELTTVPFDDRSYRFAYLEPTDKNLERYEGKHVRVLGTMRWRKIDRFPVIAVERLDMVW